MPTRAAKFAGKSRNSRRPEKPRQRGFAMDIDMHYYGTYALARAAGLSASVARRIATAAEFVDDSTDTEVIVHPDGARFRGESTAHHPTDLAPNNDRDDQLLVW